MNVPVLVLINKIDLSNQSELEKLVAAWHESLPHAEIFPISAKVKFNVDQVLNRIKELLPDSPPYFDKDQWTDKPARFFVTEIIREKSCSITTRKFLMPLKWLLSNSKKTIRVYTSMLLSMWNVIVKKALSSDIAELP